MHGTVLTAIILVLSLHGIRVGEAGQIIEFPSSGTVTCDSFGPECFQVVQDNGLIVTAIPATHHFGPFPSVSFHLTGFPPFDPSVPQEPTLNVSVEDRGAAEFTLGGQPFDLLSADITSFALVGLDGASLEAFVGDTLRISAVFPGLGAPQLTTFEFSDPAWRGITSLVFDVFSGANGAFINNVRLHVPLPASWALCAVGLMVIALRVRGGRRRPSTDRS